MQISIQLAQINSPFHYTPWNVLALEALAGHVRGLFKEEVAVTIQRIRKEEELTTLLERIANNPPHILGISPELSSLEWTEKLLRHFYQIDFSTSHRPLVVLGNKLPSYSPGYFLKQFPKAIIVVGEGEESFAGLIEYTAGKRKLESIPNLAYIKDKSEYRTQVKTPLLETLIYPPSLDTVKELVKDEKNVLVQSSRGCSWSSCSYCTSNSFRNGKKWDGFIVERVAANIEQLVSAGITELEFADDDFFGGRDDYHLNRIRQIADEIERIRKKFDKEITFRIFVIPHII
ncbi:MAG: hypothetical protein GY757_18020 [bacterium]|nr:hypothetical protein [bacterium]